MLKEKEWNEARMSEEELDNVAGGKMDCYFKLNAKGDAYLVSYEELVTDATGNKMVKTVKEIVDVGAFAKYKKDFLAKYPGSEFIEKSNLT